MILPLGFGIYKTKNYSLNLNSNKNQIFYKDSGIKTDTFEKKSEPLQQALKPTDNLTFGTYDFALKQIKGIPCAYCGKDVITHKDLDDLAKFKGKDLAQKIDSFSSEFASGTPKSVSGACSIIKNSALAYPDKSGNDLLSAIYVNSREKMIEKQKRIYEKVEESADMLGDEKLKEYIQKVKNQDKVLKPNLSFSELSDFLKNNNDIQFRKDVNARINFLRCSRSDISEKDKEIWDKVSDNIKQLPSSQNDPDAYLVKYISKALREKIGDEIEKKQVGMKDKFIPTAHDYAQMFYANLFYPFLTSTEHVHPFSQAGKSNSSNYLVAHASCNSRRSNKNWASYMRGKHNSEYFDNVIKYLNVISDKSEKKMKRFGIDKKGYLKNITKTMRNELRGNEKDPTVRKFLCDMNQILKNNGIKPLNLDPPKQKIMPVQSKPTPKRFSSDELKEISSMNGGDVQTLLSSYCYENKKAIPHSQRSAVFIVKDFMWDNPGKTIAEVAGELYDEMVEELKEKRKFDYILLKDQAQALHPTATSALTKMLSRFERQDVLLKDDISQEKLKDFMSPERQEHYLGNIKKDIVSLDGILPKKIRTKDWYLTTKSVMQTLNPQSRPEGRVLSALLNSQDKNGHFDCEKFYASLLDIKAGAA